MKPLPYAQIDKGTLLVASPDIENGLFFRSVILVCEHTPGGSFGLVINKTLDMQLPEELSHLTELSNPNIEIRTGGPMQPNQIMLLHSDHQSEDQVLEICPGVNLGGDVQFLQEAINSPSGPQIRLCFGFVAWASGELEREFLKGAWFLHPGSSKYIFELPIEKTWQTVLRDMGGKYATLSMIPEDLSLN